MKATTFIIIVLGLALATFLLSWYFEVLNAYAFGWGAAVFFSFLACIMVLQILNARNINQMQDKRGFEYCWRRTNEILSRMDNSDHMEWRGGFDRKSVLKAFTVGGKLKYYRSMYGRLVRQKIEVVAILCVEDDDIVSFISNPSPSKISDPFSDFKPFHQEQRMVMMGGRKGRRGYGVMNMPMPGQDGSGGSGGPDDDMVDRAFQGNR